MHILIISKLWQLKGLLKYLRRQRKSIRCSIKIKRQYRLTQWLWLSSPKTIPVMRKGKNICLNWVNSHYKVNNLKSPMGISVKLQICSKVLKFLKCQDKLVMARETITKLSIIMSKLWQWRMKIIFSCYRASLCVLINRNSI